MAVVRGYRKVCKQSYYRELFKNPFWMLLMGICLIAFIAANSFHTYLAASGFFFVCIIVIGIAYFGEEFHLHNRVFRRLSQLDDSYILLPYLKISNGYEHSCTSYIIVSTKGIFNIKLLEFSGILKGSEDDTVWDFADAHNAYNIEHKRIKNPIVKLRQSQKIIQSLLEKKHIDYLFLQSIFVIKNSNASFQCDTNIPVIRLKDLDRYIMGYADRPNMVYFKDDIASSILQGHKGHCCLKMFCTVD